jgi:hypothetical protein
MVKKAIILQHNGDELGSQLWNFASIYAYCLERHIPCHNYSFFEYAEYFPHIKADNLFIDSLFYNAFHKARGRKTSRYTQFFRFIYKLYVNLIRIIKAKSIIRIGQTVKYRVFHLPPTHESKEINQLEKRNVIYFDGHLFRNAQGLKKYRAEIIKQFTPSAFVRKEVDKRLRSIRKRYPHIIGVHIRGSDYLTFKRGKFFVDQGHMRAILDEFISFFKISEEIVASSTSRA